MNFLQTLCWLPGVRKLVTLSQVSRRCSLLLVSDHLLTFLPLPPAWSACPHDDPLLPTLWASPGPHLSCPPSSSRAQGPALLLPSSRHLLFLLLLHPPHMLTRCRGCTQEPTAHTLNSCELQHVTRLLLKRKKQAAPCQFPFTCSICFPSSLGISFFFHTFL